MTDSTNTYVITTAGGLVWVVMAHTMLGAINIFNRKFPGLQIASNVQAEGQL